ncbi:OmpH family outer membrane protein [Oleiharenicola lentus]|uniref:OmpH family outer membrane protein n=1 Tax=Oleiharenicola lentus TaxID=2508720 RepID=UPI003F676CC6
MKSIRPLVLSLLAAVMVAPLAAQTAPAATAPVKPAAAPTVTKVAPVSIAYVNSGAFGDPTTGLKQLVRVTQSLELEFSSQQSELSLLNEKLKTIVAELQKLAADQVANADAIKAKQVEGTALQQEMQGKQQAAQQAYNARAQEVQGPVLQQIGKALREFSKQRDIGILLDVAKIGEAILDAKPELDVTADFIGYYNTLNP